MARHVVIVLCVLCCIPISLSAPIVKASGVQWSEPKGAGKGNITVIMIPQNSSAGNDSDMIVAVKSDYQILSQDTQLLNLVVSENKNESDQSNEFKKGKSLDECSNTKEDKRNRELEKEAVKSYDTAKYFEPEKKLTLDTTNNSVDIYPVLVKNYQNLISPNVILTTPGLEYSSLNVLQLLNMTDNSKKLVNLNDKALFSMLNSNGSNQLTINNVTEMKEQNNVPEKNESIVVEGKTANITLSMVNPNDNFLNEALSILEKLKQNPSYYNDNSKGSEINSITETKDQADTPVINSKMKYLKMNDPALVPDEFESQGRELGFFGINNNDVANLQEDAMGSVLNSTPATSCIPFFLPFTNVPSTVSLVDLNIQKGMAFENVPINNLSFGADCGSVQNPNVSVNVKNNCSSVYDFYKLNVTPGQARGKPNDILSASMESVTTVSCTTVVTTVPTQTRVESNDLSKSSMMFITTETSFNQASLGVQQAKLDPINLLTTNPIVSQNLFLNFSTTTVNSQQSSDYSDFTTECQTSTNDDQTTSISPQPKLDLNYVFTTSTECPSLLINYIQTIASPQQARVEPNDILNSKENCSTTLSDGIFSQVTVDLQKSKVETIDLLNTTIVSASPINSLGKIITPISQPSKVELQLTTECVTTPGSNQAPINIQSQQAIIPGDSVVIIQNGTAETNKTQIFNSENNTKTEFGNCRSTEPTVCPTVGISVQEPNNLKPESGALPKKITLEPPVNCDTLLQRRLETSTSVNFQNKEVHLRGKDLTLPLVESSVFLANNNEIPKGKDIPISLNALNASFDEIGVPDVQEQDDKVREKVVYLYNNNNNNPSLFHVDSDEGALLKPLVISKNNFVQKRPLLAKGKIPYPDINQILKMHFAGKNIVLEQKPSYRTEMNKIDCNQTISNEPNEKMASSESESDDYESQGLHSNTTKTQSGNWKTNQELQTTTMKQTEFFTTIEEDEGLLTILNREETISRLGKTQETKFLNLPTTENEGHTTENVLIEEGIVKSLTTTSQLDFEDTTQAAFNVYTIMETHKVEQPPVEESTVKNQFSSPRQKQASKVLLKSQCTKPTRVSSTNGCSKQNAAPVQKKLIVPGGSVQKIVIEIMEKTKKPYCKSDKIIRNLYQSTSAENQNVSNQKDELIPEEDSNVKQQELSPIYNHRNLEERQSLELLNFANSDSVNSEQEIDSMNSLLKNEALSTELEGQSKFNFVGNKQIPDYFHQEILVDNADIPQHNYLDHSDTSLGANVMKFRLVDKSEVKDNS